MVFMRRIEVVVEGHLKNSFRATAPRSGEIPQAGEILSFRGCSSSFFSSLFVPRSLSEHPTLVKRQYALN